MSTYFYFLNFLSFIIHLATASDYKVFVKTTRYVREVPESFLSVSLDTNIARYKWCGLNFSFIEPLAKELAPSYLRFGGTEADALIFQEKADPDFIMEVPTLCPARADTTRILHHFTFTGHQLDQIYNFAKNTGMRFIFDLNMVLRSGSRWDPSNAIQFIEYAKRRRYDLDFELGNEPDHYENYFNISVNGSQVAKDYRHLRKLLNSYKEYKGSKIIGPSIGSYAQILKDFVAHGGKKYVDGLSFHFYYLAGQTAKLEDFLNSTILDYLDISIGRMKNLTNGSIWLGEGSSAYNGGAPNISDTFASGFMYLDMLGLSALKGVDVVVRQDLFHGNYSLLNDSMMPNHDFWLAVLYKKLVGQQILDPRFHPKDSSLRLYAACNKKNNGLVLYGLKLTNDPFTINLPQFYDKKANVYLFKEAEPGNLRSKRTKLNGRLLEWNPAEPFPKMHGLKKSFPITLPGHSQFFIEISSKIKACQYSYENDF